MPVYPYVGTTAYAETIAAEQYVLRSRHELNTIFERHFVDLCEQYDEKYAASYVMYRLERRLFADISRVIDL